MNKAESTNVLLSSRRHWLKDMNSLNAMTLVRFHHRCKLRWNSVNFTQQRSWQRLSFWQFVNINDLLLANLKKWGEYWKLVLMNKLDSCSNIPKAQNLVKTDRNTNSITSIQYQHAYGHNFRSFSIFTCSFNTKIRLK